MPEIDPVILELHANMRDYRTELARAQRLSDQTFGNIERRGNSMATSLSRSARLAGGSIVAYLGTAVTLATARGILRILDSAKSLEAQLRLATRESGNFAQAQEDVRRIALSTRSSLEDTAQLYATFQRNARELGITQEQSARATETVTKAFQISGATAAEAAGGLRQFLQGLQSGALRGEELNSVLENAPRLAKLLAEGLGVTVGQLRAMGQEGDLAAEKLINALTNRKYTEGIDAEFRELPVTFDQAMTQVSNAAIITFGAFDRGGGFSQMLSNFISDGVSGFADMEAAAQEAGIDMRATFEGLGDVFEPMLAGARSVFGQIGLESQSLRQQIANTLGDIDKITGFLGTSIKFTPGGRFGIGGVELDTNNGTNLRQTFEAGAQRAEQQRRATLAAQAAADRVTNSTPGGRASPSGGGAATRRRGPSAESLAAKAERDRLAAIREEGEKQRDLLGLQDDIIAARAALATAADDVASFELQQLSIDQAARLSQLNTQRRLGELTDEEYAVRAKALAEETALRRQLIGVRRAEAQSEADMEALRQRQDQMALEADALYARADIADTLEKRRFLEASALAIQQEIERSLLEQAIAEGRIADAAAARAALADRQSSETTAQERANQGPLGDYLDRTSDPRTLAEEAAVREMEAVRDGIADGLAEKLGTKNQFVKDLFSIFLDQVIFRPLAESLRGLSGGAGGGGGGGLLGGLFNAALATLGLPGFANGGSMTIGGRTGSDNNTLSLNGAPIARVSRGERLDITPNQRLRGQAGPTVVSAPQFDLRGAVMTPQLYADMERISKANAAQAGVAAYQRSMKDAPGAVADRRRYGSR